MFYVTSRSTSAAPIVMGNSCSTDQVLPYEALQEYAELTYLTKSEIRYVFGLLNEIAPGGLHSDLRYRFSKEQVAKVFPQIQHNPFRDMIYRTFSSEQDDHLSFEDLLDICSAFSENCPEKVRAIWAFLLLDFDGDNQLSLTDLMEAVERLTRFEGEGASKIDGEQAKQVAEMILKEMDLAQVGSISPQEFVQLVSRMPDFSHTFRFKV